MIRSRLLKCLPLLAATLALGVMAAPKPAHAWGRFGVFVGFPPVVLGGPFYYPPPIYYPPPYDYAPYAPPYDPPAAPPPGTGGQAAPAGFTCYAKPYICPLQEMHQVGESCACEALGGGSVAGTVQ
jgi:hypothetical protein